jgi:hypothetical protein
VTRRLCIYAKGDSFEHLHTMVGLVSTAASMDWEAHVYMTYGVLWRYVHGSMAEAEVTIHTPEVKAKYLKGIDAGRIPDLDDLFEEARELGGLRVHDVGQAAAPRRGQARQVRRPHGARQLPQDRRGRRARRHLSAFHGERVIRPVPSPARPF